MYDVHNPPMMECGHAANSTYRDKVTGQDLPACAICPIAAATTLAEVRPSLDGRMAGCSYCRATVPSRYALPFFSYREGKATDSYYCGCRGWD